MSALCRGPLAAEQLAEHGCDTHPNRGLLGHLRRDHRLVGSRSCAWCECNQSQPGCSELINRERFQTNVK